MFTGLIESVGHIEEVKPTPAGFRLRVTTPLAAELRPGDSLAINGVCLTVVDHEGDEFTADVMAEMPDPPGYSAVRAMLGSVEPTRLTLQNIQARVRAQRMWNWSNTSGGLFVQTGNMSEKAVGYTTIGGDLEGLQVQHPFYLREVPLILGDHVNVLGDHLSSDGAVGRG